jgi:hypothetical protein
VSSVDVVVPCYNYGRYLRECVESVLTQEGVDVRVLIIDDCSPDNTPEVGQQLAAEDSRVEYRRHATNQGHIATYNEGLLEWASADYCLLLSADDLLVPRAFERAIDVLDSNDTIAFAHGRAIRIGPEGVTAEKQLRQDTGSSYVVSGNATIEKFCKVGGNLVETPTAIVRTSTQHRVGGYRGDLPHTGDMEMWMRLALYGSVAYVDCFQAYYRRHPGNMSNDFPDCRIADLLQRQLAIEAILAIAPYAQQEIQRLHSIALASIARGAQAGAYKAFEQGDTVACRECQLFARRTYPAIVRSNEWRKMECKRFFGPRAWGAIRKMMAPLRWQKKVHQLSRGM